MAGTLMTEFLRKLKKEVERSFEMNRKTFPNDEENCIESADISTKTAGASNLVICKGEPSSFWMDDETNDKASRRESEDSLLKFAIRFSKNKDRDSSSSGESDTKSGQHHAHGSTWIDDDLPSDEHADTGGGENLENGQSNNRTDQLNNDEVNGIDRINPDTNECGESGQIDTLNTNEDDENSFISEENQSSASSPGVSNGGNSPDVGLRQRRANGKRKDVEIENVEDNEKEHFQTPEGHLESYLCIMKYLGISSFRRVEYRRLGVTVDILLKVLFWIVSTGAFFNSIRSLKRVAIEQAPYDKDLQYCLKIGFALIRCFSRFYFIKIAGTQSKKLSVMLLHVRKPRSFTKDVKFSFSKLSVFLAVTTFFFTLVKVFFGYLAVKMWDWNGALRFRAFTLSSTLFVWSSDSNITEALEDEVFDSDLTTIHVVMGLFEGFLDFCGTLQGEAIRDLLILACVTIYNDQTAIEKRIKPQLLVHPNNIDPVEVEGSLRHFKCVNDESSYINGTLVTPFKFVTIQNLLLYAYLFVQLLGYNGVTMHLIHSSVDALKGLVLFYIGMRLHWKNASIKKWLHLMSSYTGPVDIEAILGMSVQSAISDFRDDPIGLGSDYFLINETFMVGLIAAVGSVISVLFELDKYQVMIRRLLH